MSDLAPRLGIVTVTYFPDLAVLARQLVALPGDAVIVVVDNTGIGAARGPLQALLKRWPAVELIENDHNMGLAAAFNRGVARLAARACEAILLLDQDSEPLPGAVDELHRQWQQRCHSHPRLGAVGPRLCESEGGVEHGFHRLRYGLWQRHVPPVDALAPIRVSSLNGSGTLMSLPLYQALGGLDESLFIDHVDTEWSFRLLAAGYELLGLPGVRFEHRMGRSTSRVWLLGWRAWPSRSPIRHYYLYRNTLVLLRRRGVPFAWKVWATLRMIVNYALQFFGSEEGQHQRKAMRRGWRDGLRGRGGESPLG